MEMRTLVTEDEIRARRLFTSKVDVMRSSGVWAEATRYRVRDEKGTLQFVVEMSNRQDIGSALRQPRRVRSQAYFFLLDGQDVRRASEDRFVNLATGEILVVDLA